MNVKYIILLGLLAVGFIVGSQSLFTVDQTQQAIVLQLGQPIGKPRQPGLHFKTPFVQTVRYFDRRILSIDAPPEQVVISSAQTSLNKGEQQAEQKAEQILQDQTPPNQDNNESAAAPANNGPRIESVSGEPIIVDTFARYKIIDPLQFMKTLRSVQNASSRIESILNDSARAVLGETTLPELLSKERTDVMAEIRKRVNDKVSQDELGIEIVDVRIVRADLTDELRDSTVKQMNSALQERATERRAQGDQRALEIRSTAEKEKTVILAEAQRDASIIQGEGDKEAIKIYAEAFNVDKDFYAFLRSMEAYEKTMANPQTRLVLSPDSPFFKYFNEEK